MQDVPAITFASLRIEHVPEQGPPFIQKAALRAFLWQVWCGKVARPLEVYVVLVVSIAALVVCSAVGGWLPRAIFHDVHWLIAVEE